MKGTSTEKSSVDPSDQHLADTTARRQPIIDQLRKPTEGIILLQIRKPNCSLMKITDHISRSMKEPRTMESRTTMLERYDGKYTESRVRVSLTA